MQWPVERIRCQPDFFGVSRIFLRISSEQETVFDVFLCYIFHVFILLEKGVFEV